MKKIIAFCALGLMVSPAFAAKNCEELKTEIAAKLDAKNVKGYTLEIVATETTSQPTLVSGGANGNSPMPIGGSIQGQKSLECIDCVDNSAIKIPALKIVGSCEAGTKKITYKKD